jgi:hypothetical protein
MSARPRARSMMKIESKNSLYPHSHFTEHPVNTFKKSRRKSDLNHESLSHLSGDSRDIPTSLYNDPHTSRHKNRRDRSSQQEPKSGTKQAVVSLAATENKGEVESRENHNTEPIRRLEIKTGSCDHDLRKKAGAHSTH